MKFKDKQYKSNDCEISVLSCDEHGDYKVKLYNEISKNEATVTFTEKQLEQLLKNLGIKNDSRRFEEAD